MKASNGLLSESDSGSAMSNGLNISAKLRPNGFSIRLQGPLVPLRITQSVVPAIFVRFIAPLLCTNVSRFLLRWLKLCWTLILRSLNRGYPLILWPSLQLLILAFSISSVVRFEVINAYKSRRL